LVRAPRSEDVTDGELLERFVARREEAAFAELLRRYGPMVLCTCRGLLRNAHDAEDAFQATFLVLVRRAGALEKRACLGSWLYAVARRTALSARRAAARRWARERRVGAMRESEHDEQAAERELSCVLREEVSRLPEKYQAPVVLCYLEGMTNEEAARRLGCPTGTILSRLARGRDKLRGRLARRGVALSASGLAAALAQSVAPAAPPAALLTATLKAAALVAAGKTVAVGALSPGVAALTEGVLKAMFLTKLKSAAAVLLALVVAGAGLGLMGYRLWAAGPARDPEAAAPAPQVVREKAKKEAGPPRPETKGRTEPPGAPLVARLIARKDTYVLDLGGKTPEELRKLLKDPIRLPAAPAVDLALELRNSGAKDLKFLVGGYNPDVPLLLKLDGPGAVNITLRPLLADIMSKAPQQVTLAPGEGHTLPIKGLMTNRLGREGSASYWTKPGDYTLIATYKTAVSPVPKGAKDRGDGFGPVTVISAPVRLKVVQAKKAKAAAKP
jgi:RNA polymerase sigma factor (sigma-70 family)